MAALAITDDKPNTLKKMSKAMPWHSQALSMIVGSKEEALKALSLTTTQQLSWHIVVPHQGLTG